MGYFYTIFRTKWGYFGIAGTEDGLMETILPCPGKDTAERYILTNNPRFQYQKRCFLPLQERIKSYFEGAFEDFGDVAVNLGNLGDFSRAVLAAVRNVTTGNTSTYADIAKQIKRPKAYRAAANAIGRNPVPLIIPCHRILCSDGHLGGFSCPVGGVETKARLLEHEK